MEVEVFGFMIRIEWVGVEEEEEDDDDILGG